MADLSPSGTLIRPVSLHVAYGGFHLTLAGFDKPFDLLEAIAQPLRAAADIAGPGVPPQPDEDMLRRVVGDALQRAVSVSVAGSHVILRPLAARPADPEPTPQAPPEPDPPAEQHGPPLLLRPDQRVDTAF
jgi:hypothetical protein